MRLDEFALKVGDCFVYDAATYADGDLLYVEVLELVPHFPSTVDHVGSASNGYRVAVYSFDDFNQQPSTAEDHYGSDFVNRRCVRLSAAEMQRARCAGWPNTYLRFREILGNDLPLTDFRGAPVGSLAELEAAASHRAGRSA